MSKKKPYLAIILTLLLLLAAALGGWYYLNNRPAEPVYVYNFNMIGMTEFWGDSRESSGPVTTDRIQTVFLSDTQTVSEILVEEGTEVKKGDVLMTFDTTLSQLELERKGLEVQKLEMELEDSQKKLREIGWMVPMTTPPETDPVLRPLPDGGEFLGQEYRLYYTGGHDGSSPQRAVVCWVRSDTVINESMIYRVGKDMMRYMGFDYLDIEVETLPEETLPGETESPQPEEDVLVVVPETPTETVGMMEGYFPMLGGEYIPDGSENLVPYLGILENEPVNVELTTRRRDIVPFFAIIKVTSGNLSTAEPIAWYGIHVDSRCGFRFFDARDLEDYSLPVPQPEEGEETEPPIDYYGSGHTAAEIAEMKNEEMKKIRELDLKLKMAKAEYKIMERELADGNVYAELDGTVVSVLTEEAAKLDQQPLIKLSGGGGFYVEVSISELERDNMELGQEVTVSDWETGMTYPGTISSIGDYPTSSLTFSGIDNPNASTYPLTVFVEGTAQLKSGAYVAVQYSSSSNQNGIYLEKPYLRTEQGSSYVLLRGEDGTLQRREVVTGKSVWGSYTEILDGLTEEDWIAFPYGKNVRQGVPTQEGDYSTLYGN